MTHDEWEVSALSRVIWKTTLRQEKTQTIEVPEEWRPLSFGNQGGDPVLWYEAEPMAEKVQRVVFLAFTGEEAPQGAKFIGTQFFGLGGFIVIHCYVK